MAVDNFCACVIHRTSRVGDARIDVLARVLGSRPVPQFLPPEISRVVVVSALSHVMMISALWDWRSLVVVTATEIWR